MGLNTCCFCVPLRTGVTVIATISFLFYLACLISFIMGRDGIHSFPKEDLSAVLGIYWTAVAVVSLYTASSLLGILGGATQNRTMINIFRFLYWTMALLILVTSTVTWIMMLVKRNSIVSECQRYLLEQDSKQNSYYTPVTLPDGRMVAHQEDCTSATKQVIIIIGIFVFLGNFIQLYFASAINAYARRLKSIGTIQHHKLRDMDEFPETAKMTVY
ncbi:hypothetical protein BCV72DRAFT_102306 [Rhizopus microsporus var. microsporus]|uniref:Uncharacterized protein n=2 Tax=Rhizopus microsporus TaxID=58291 RepID=A0A2G4SM36_RHIZD|nr:uncharacterized protein RHIMIDRAFT_47513 [Rhizopus microsporus ATCC 52813]ORE07732.1 hypothetical protein BCV72DRAFT_102306 [Rhizopus microsporus var. microsporus]PHZ09456.1 hypothetical protein RHIMIDRAFT_47513 [Rhizopus microsporus ATCC 52813]